MKSASFPRFQLSVALILVTACGFLTSCSAAEQLGTGATQNSHPINTPDFSGPWADLFRDEYSRAPNDEIRGYLSDEVITEAENQAVTEAFRKCMNSRGLTFDDFEYDGSYRFGYTQVSGPDEANEIATDCEMSTGADQVSFLYHQIKLNPENKDRNPDIAACLVRAGAVPSDYTADDYKDYPLWEQTITNVEAAKDAEEACRRDPSGSFRG